jgi:peptidylprolyl isomerase domain and WD repeat-containing protein 1
VRIYGAPTFGLLAILDVHSSPIVCMRYISAVDTVVSADVRGVIEYWRHDDDAGGSFDEDDDFVANSKIELTRPTLPTDVVRFRHKVETDLFELAKKKAEPCVIEASRDGKRFSITAKDAQVVHLKKQSTI